MEIINLTTNPTYYHEQIRRAISHISMEDSQRDIHHRLELGGRLAQQGDREARQLLYDIFDHTDEETRDYAATTIIEVDEIDGFIVVAEQLGAAARATTQPSVDDRLLFWIEDIAGEEQAQAVLTIARQHKPDLDFYLNLVEDYRKQSDMAVSRKQRRQQNRRILRSLSYAEVKQRLDKGERLHLRQWAQEAAPDDLRHAADDLLQMTDAAKIWQRIRIFDRQPFPYEPSLLFPLVEIQSEYYSVATATFMALSQITHPTVRDFALKQMKEGRYPEQAVGLLARNFQPGDWERIVALTQKPLNRHQYHNLAMNIQDVFDAHPVQAAIPALLWGYECNPCASCRERVLVRLASLDAIPDTIQQECLYDSNFDIRDLAQRHFTIDVG